MILCYPWALGTQQQGEMKSTEHLSWVLVEMQLCANRQPYWGANEVNSFNVKVQGPSLRSSSDTIYRCLRIYLYITYSLALLTADPLRLGEDLNSRTADFST